ncbi:NAD(P)-dependent oxidoreductase [Orrella sp. 11846]|uniref:NAD(P)-dependent oxidoreductase n=1 Tax=Orrella sp. 11846 TaxID=3409913 RepID=UPI003B597A1C
MRARVLLTNPIHPEHQANLAKHVEVVLADDVSPQTLRKAAADCDAMIVRTHLPEDVFEDAPRMKYVVRHGVGVDMIPVDRATELGIVVANLPGANTAAVTEYALAAIFQVNRPIVAYDQALRAQSWDVAKSLSTKNNEIAGSVCGIIGVGAIGQRLAGILMAMGVTVLGHTRRPETLPEGVEAVSFEELLKRSDTIVLACPLNDQTYHLINAQAIAAMKPGVTLINVARGAVIDHTALVPALQSGQVGAAVLDVHEPAILTGQEAILSCPNTLLTAHQAGITATTLERLSREAVNSLLSLINGENQANVVNPAAWEMFHVKHSKS